MTFRSLFLRDSGASGPSHYLREERELKQSDLKDQSVHVLKKLQFWDPNENNWNKGFKHIQAIKIGEYH